MKIYIVNVNNCEAYSDYREGNWGAYLTHQDAVDAMTELGFDPSTKIRIIPWYGFEDEKNWYKYGWYDCEEYRIEKWELPERTCKPMEKDGVMRCSECDYPLGIMSLPAYCAGCGAKVVE